MWTATCFWLGFVIMTPLLEELLGKQGTGRKWNVFQRTSSPIMARKVHQNGRKTAYPLRPSPTPVSQGWIWEWRMKVGLPPKTRDFHFLTYLIYTLWSFGLPHPSPVIAFDNVQRTEKSLQISGCFCGCFSKKMMNEKKRSIRWAIDNLIYQKENKPQHYMGEGTCFFQ